MKLWDCVPGRAKYIERWNCMAVSRDAQILQDIKKLICNVTFVYICAFCLASSKFQCITTTVCDNNKQYRYISVLLLWSQIVLVCCFSGKCLMYRNVLVECWGESYCWLMLGENTNCYVCECAEEKLSTYIADSIQSSWITCEKVGG